MTLSLSRIESAEKASKVSAQSPAWSRKPCPSATVARVDWRVLASPANTSGGWAASSPRTRSRTAGSGQSGCWAAGNARQESGAQGLDGVSTVGFIGLSSQMGAGACISGSPHGAEPAPLPWRLDGPPVVVGAHPADGLAGAETVEDGQGGQGGAGAADAAAAPFPRTRAKSAGPAGSPSRRPRTRAPPGRETTPVSSSQLSAVIAVASLSG